MIAYHGTPIWPVEAAVKVLCGRHAFVSFAHADQLDIVRYQCSSFALDNGAFSHWKKGTPIKDWSSYYEWAGGLADLPSCEFAVIPDVIDGTERDNDRLIEQWPLSRFFGVPVWHMHERPDRLIQLVNQWPRVAIGSSGEYQMPGSKLWWARMDQAMRVACDDRGAPRAKIHGLRMLSSKLVRHLPFSSADSTNIAANIGIDSKWRGTYQPMTKIGRALCMADRIESVYPPERWKGRY